jgi:hypothetical protein
MFFAILAAFNRSSQAKVFKYLIDNEVNTNYYG